MTVAEDIPVAASPVKHSFPSALPHRELSDAQLPVGAGRIPSASTQHTQRNKGKEFGRDAETSSKKATHHFIYAFQRLCTVSSR